MTDEDAPAPLVVRPLARLRQLETDAFCEGCGYNLHGQIVALDERLGIPVCRCPECGRFHAAGRGTSAAYPWLSRFALALVAFWLLFSLWLLSMAAIGTGTVQYAYLDTFTRTVWQTRDGKNVRAPDAIIRLGVPQPIDTDVQRRRQVRPWPAPVDDSESGLSLTGPGWPDIIAMYAALLTVGLGTAMFLVIALWHWKKSRYRWVLLAPFVIAAATFFLWARVPGADAILGWSISRLLCMAAAQALAAWVGLKIGRPLARLVVRIVVPPRPRQLLAFLWLADGRPAPPPV